MGFFSRFLVVATVAIVGGLAACAADPEEASSAGSASEETGSTQEALTASGSTVHVYWTCPELGDRTKFPSSKSCTTACESACRIHAYCGTLAHPVACH